MEVVNLLGSSQTFIGVLTTIVLLCVVTGSGNFIFVFLRDIKRKTEIKAADLRAHLRAEATILKEGIAYDELTHLSKEISATNSAPVDLKSLTDYYIVSFQAKIDSLTNGYSEKFFLPLKNKIREIRDCKEQTFSPLYVSAYCLLLFMCDEIVSWNHRSLPFIVTMLTVLTAGSIFFLSGVWVKFFLECGKISPIVRLELSDNECNGDTMPKCWKVLLAYYLLPFVVVFCGLWMVDSWVIELPVWVTDIIVVSTILVPMIIVGWNHINIRQKYGRYSQSFLFWHFISLIVISLMVGGIFILPLELIESARMVYSDVLWEFKLMVIVFIALFGLILPFAVPYLCYRHVYSNAIRKCDAYKSELNRELETVGKDVKATIAQLKEQIRMIK